MSDELTTCNHCGAKNAPSSFSCYSCMKPLPGKDDIHQNNVKAEQEEETVIEITITMCTVCRLMGKDRDERGSKCWGCAHNPDSNRDIGCGCLFLAVLVFTMLILMAV